MKLISLNVGLFEANNDQVSYFLKQQSPDLICLQEVTRRIQKSANSLYISKPPIATATTHLNQSFFGPVTIIKEFYQTNFHDQEEFYFDLGGRVEFGNYVRTKYQITKAQNIFVQNHLTYVTDWTNWPQEDYRAFQVVDLEIGDYQLRLINYHGIWSADKQDSKLTIQANEMIKEVAQEVDYPTIICGDFNLLPETRSIQLLKKDFVSLADIYKIHSTRPINNALNHLERNVVDYIFVSQKVHVKHFEVLPLSISDHLPLVLEFEL